MSEEETSKTGITTSDDIDPHMAYTETLPTRKPKTKVTKKKQKQRMKHVRP